MTCFSFFFSGINAKLSYFYHLNKIHPSINFKLEIETNMTKLSQRPHKKRANEPSTIEISRKPTQTDLIIPGDSTTIKIQTGSFQINDKIDY